MNCRTSFVILAAMAAAGSAYGASVPVSLASGGTNDGAVDGFVQYVTSVEEHPSFAAIDGSGFVAQNPPVYSFALVGSGIEFDGGPLMSRLAIESDFNAAAGSDRGFSVAPPIGTFSDAGGLANPNNIPLPAPVAMGGIGLLSLGGFAAWRRRAQA